ncbi:hypothetical protein MAR_036688 [Mya arenaria]|uniref:Uncharacterized protein n=1 Tax=Mya arenaria TaxID=6604 RepID=A0ABY7FPD3_MYAAR|nr:hypothetical protein MAR_036688 [Mya arenaria]
MEGVSWRHDIQILLCQNKAGSSQQIELPVGVSGVILNILLFLDRNLFVPTLLATLLDALNLLHAIGFPPAEFPKVRFNPLR